MMRTFVLCALGVLALAVLASSVDVESRSSSIVSIRLRRATAARSAVAADSDVGLLKKSKSKKKTTKKTKKTTKKVTKTKGGKKTTKKTKKKTKTKTTKKDKKKKGDKKKNDGTCSGLKSGGAGEEMWKQCAKVTHEDLKKWLKAVKKAGGEKLAGKKMPEPIKQALVKYAQKMCKSKVKGWKNKVICSKAAIKGGAKAAKGSAKVGYLVMTNFKKPRIAVVNQAKGACCAAAKEMDGFLTKDNLKELGKKGGKKAAKKVGKKLKQKRGGKKQKGSSKKKKGARGKKGKKGKKSKKKF